MFELAAAGGTWTPNVLYDFPVKTEGAVPYAGLIADWRGQLLRNYDDGRRLWQRYGLQTCAE